MVDNSSPPVFDMAFSMGFSCGGTMALRRANLQFAAYPLDWIGSPGIVPSARMIAADFADWLRREDLRLVGVRGGRFQTDVYQNVRTRFGFPHDFSRFDRFDAAFDAVRAKYDRRIARFLGALGRAKSALVVYIARPIDPRAADADLIAAKRILEERFPNVTFELVYFFLESGRTDFAETSVAEGITAVACDYGRMDHGEISHAIRANVPAAYLRARFAVDDPRTETEKAAWQAKIKARRRWKSGNWFDAVKYRLHRRLERELQEKGLLPRDFPLWFD